MLIFSNWRSYWAKLEPNFLSITSLKKYLRNPSLVVWIIILLSTLLLLAILQLIVRFQIPSVPTKLSVPQSSVAPNRPTLDKLAELHLFGQNMSSKDINLLPKTILQLELKGIYSSTSPELGSAIIAIPGESAKVYLVGDTLPGGAVLLDVYADRVILRRAGGLEVLSLPQNFLQIKQ